MLSKTRLLPTLLWILLAGSEAPAQTEHKTSPGPIKVWFLTGGGYHDFARARQSLPALARAAGNLKIMPPPRSQGPGDQLGALPFQVGRQVIVAYTQGERGFSARDRQRLLDFVHQGGGFVGIHCAADSHPGWAAYTRMLGGRFNTHPPYQQLSLDLDVKNHVLTRGLPDHLSVTDEFYYLQDCALDDKLVLLSGRAPDGQTRPVAWVREYGAGRVFYTILGHDQATWGDPNFQTLIRRAMVWAAQAGRPKTPNTYVLFNGKNLDGWSMSGPGRFSVEDGALATHGGMGLLWYRERRFRDFKLSLEWKVASKAANSGVFVRFPAPPGSPWDAVKQGYEIQICDTAPARQRTGSIYDFQDASRLASHPVGQWNRYEITVRGQDFSVRVNGTDICKFQGKRGREGYIGLQNHDEGSAVRFRNIRVQVLKQP